MKLSKYLVGTLACALMAACSNEDVQDNVQTESSGEEAYMAVNLIAPNVTSRATFDEGEGNESTVGSARFYFFDDNGNAVDVNGDLNYIDLTSGITLTDPHSGTEGDNVENQFTMLVLDAKSGAPTKMVAVLNPQSLAPSTRLTLTQLRDYPNSYESATGDKQFVMSNSVYLDGSNVKVDATDITGKVYTSKDAAEDNPVAVYVERVLAKVDVTKSDAAITDETESEDTEIDFNNENVYVKIKGWTLANRSAKSYLIKNLDNSWTTTTPFADWSDVTNHRSYWAKTCTTDGVLNDKSYKNITTFTTQYCHERTQATNDATMILVAAQLVDDEGDAITIAEYAGVPMTLDGLKTTIANQIKNTPNGKVYYHNGTGYTELAPEQIDFRTGTADETDVESYEVVAKLAESASSTTFYKDNTGTEEYTTNEVNAILAGYKALIWNNGMTYYFTSIEHKIGAEEAREGVVRNHYYKVNITGITGLGTPVFDPSINIVPEEVVDDNSYVAAQINVLSWAVVSQQDVVLGQ